MYSDDSGDIRHRVRSVWPSGGTHLPQGTGLERRRRPCSKKDEREPAGPLCEWLHDCPSARTHSRCTHILSHARSHARTYAPPWWSITLSTRRTHVSARSQSPSEIKPALTLPEEDAIWMHVQRNAMCRMIKGFRWTNRYRATGSIPND